jgi:signal transduction histidine kinase
MIVRFSIFFTCYCKIWCTDFERLRYNFWLIFLTFFGAWYGVLAQPLTSIYPQSNPLRLGDSVEVFRDASRELTLQDILQPKYSSAFQRNKGGGLGFGWTNDAVWLRCSVRAGARGVEQFSWILEVGYMGLDSVSLFIQDPSNREVWREMRSGGSVPFAQREEVFHGTMFPLVLPRDSVLTLYVRSVATCGLYLDMLVVERRAQENRMEWYDVVLGMLFGIMIAAILYNLIIFISIRDWLYAYYLFYTFSAFCALVTMRGLLIKHFFPFAMPYMGIIINVTTLLFYIGGLLFCKEFLLVSKHSPRVERLLVWAAWGFGVCILPTILFPRIGLIVAINVLPNMLMITAALVALRKGYWQARIYLVGWLPLLVFASYFGLSSYSVFIEEAPRSFSMFTAAVAFEVTVFSFALAYRFRRMRDDARFAEQEKEIEHLRNVELTNANRKLEGTLYELETSHLALLQEKTKTQQLNDELLASNHEKTEILGIVAHDLQNPITAVRGLAEVLCDTSIEKDQIPPVVQQITLTTDRMLRLVTNLLDSQRLETGAVQLHLAEVDIVPLLERTVQHYAAQAASKGITIHHNSNAVPILVIADEQALAQVLDNILSNAVKYSPHGKNVFVRMNTSSDRVRIEIQDEGEGISKDDMQKLFGKFARLTARPTGGEHSTGLGLSIVKKMVRAMNGRVWCESEVGKGATFIVELHGSSNIPS